MAGRTAPEDSEQGTQSGPRRRSPGEAQAFCHVPAPTRPKPSAPARRPREAQVPAWSTSEASRTRGRPAPTNRLSPKNRSSGRAPEPQADSSAGAMEPGDAGRRVTASPVPPPFVRVAPSLFLGSARAAGAEEQLARAGVTLCVNVSRQQPGPGAPGVAELRVPVFDDPAEDLLAHLEPTCAAMEAAVRGGGACLVYCKNGRSRSAAVCTAYLMRHRGLSLAQAFQMVKSARPVAEPNPGFWSQLQKYEEALQAQSCLQGEPPALGLGPEA